MSPNTTLAPVEGSERPPLTAEPVSSVDPNRVIDVVVVLNENSPAVLDWLNSVLDVVSVQEETRTINVQGNVAQVSAAFGVDLAVYADGDGGKFRGREGAVHFPADLADSVLAVLGLDDRAVAAPYLRPLDGAAANSAASLTPLEVAKAYSFPAGDGKGQTVGIIELGGGYDDANLHAYFSGLGVSSPTVIAVPVAGGSNRKDGANGADGEVQLDIEIVGAIAPGAILRVYFGPNTDAGFLAAINKAIDDKCNTITISWGQSESGWTAQSMRAFDQSFSAANAAGISVFAAAGDNGSTDGTSDGHQHADFPASSPNVTACGGTRLVITASGEIADETVWNDNSTSSATGGGYSGFFARPGYQAASLGSMRGLPDISGNADPQSGYQVRVDGQNFVIGGTSAVAPLLAAMTALLNAQAGKPVGALNVLAYATPTAFRDVTVGNNGAYRAGPGWDASSGLGTPNAGLLAAAIGGGGGQEPPFPPNPDPNPQPDPNPTPDPVPTPAPTPVVDVYDEALVNACDHWAMETHRGDNKRAAQAYLLWKQGKNL